MTNVVFNEEKLHIQLKKEFDAMVKSKMEEIFGKEITADSEKTKAFVNWVEALIIKVYWMGKPHE